MADNVEKFSKLAEKGKIAKLITYITHKDADVRAAAATALGLSNSDDAYNALVNMIRDSSMEVRACAVRSLQVSGRPGAVEHIRHASANQTDPVLLNTCKEAVNAMLNG